jgi:hypothetical protein
MDQGPGVMSKVPEHCFDDDPLHAHSVVYSFGVQYDTLREYRLGRKS